MNEARKFRLGMIGAGTFAEANLFPSLSLHFFDDVDRTGVCDIREERAARLAGKYGWRKTYTDYRDMLDREDPDAVVVCLGAKNHPAVAEDLARRGVPFFLEKPSSVYPEDTAGIARLASENNVQVQVGHQKRYGLAYIRARDIVRSRELFGEVMQIESKMHGFTVFPTFYTCMLEWQCHNLDLAISFGGQIRELDAWARLDSPRTGALTVMIRFEGGALGTLAWGTYGGPGPFSERIEVLGNNGCGVIVENARVVTSYTEDTGERWTSDWNPISKNQSHVFNGYVGELRSFIDCVRSGSEPTPSIHQEAETMRWLGVIARKAGIPVIWEPVASAL
jgi:predicted dehydrogenase